MNASRYITYPHVVSSLALFIALGGSAYAVTQIDPNSVGTKQLKPNAVKSGKIADRTIKRVDAKQGAFATTPQLAGKLGVGATAANAAKLGNIGPGGFVKGNGTQFSASYDITNDDDVVTVAGGGKVNVQCSASSGYFVLFLAGSTTYDLLQFEYVDNAAQPNVFHDTREPSDVLAFAFTKEEAVFKFDAKSAAGPAASVTVYARYDDATNRCIGRVRGTNFPS